ncbi:RrF2 family transcriptional regulator [Lactiplantibacillus mudanjiangensis]|uniref:Transcriptional regulator [Lactobacillus hokkaidonensis JCM] n=1 Tax=Lactiplantibacillus mudanjiangensis TaxID=1296538 RepID=A0A660E6A9_9LACO|nr:Rrf2 family transcriptional regulator [Lactiplantibacillus mudanjiangensis]VDG25439.1 transcriptional regulator [Lactobacillus hokkaidonensis JCM] [Lactiplantibacillus mudanjiangensis]VDG28533.1 transcriptional regulator [Lactobacillus hokkaidonensis JCM] [Lactiplantibacillus mudanjiangensis]VDG31081.1 transcriptional regulator [Lactobacillus hokkaidonensis JCM] [Lactiplantibacillus mudanjiangensis]
MKINKSTQQGIYVLLMLALQQGHTPLKSQLISQRLAVSDSYLKKILRKLVLAGLVDSSASKDGGFSLKQPITGISLFDVSDAVEQVGTLQMPPMDLAQRLFPGDDEHIRQSEQVALQAFERANMAFNEKLKRVTLDQLLEADSFQTGVVDWQSMS